MFHLVAHQCIKPVTDYFIAMTYERIERYGRNSVKHAFYSLCAFPPDPFPLIVLVSAIFSTLLVCSNLLQGKIKVRNWIVLIGTWSGHHAMVENRIRKELKETVKNLIVQLDRAEKQLGKWDEVIEGESEKLKQLQDASKNLQETSEALTGVLQEFKIQVDLQKELCQDYLRLILKMDEGSRQAQEALGKHQINAEKISEILARQIRELKEIHQEQLKTVELQKKLEKGLIAKTEELRKLKEGKLV